MAFGKTSCPLAERFLIWQITEFQIIGIQLIFKSQTPKNSGFKNSYLHHRVPKVGFDSYLYHRVPQLIFNSYMYKGNWEQIVKRLKMGFHRHERAFVYRYWSGSARIPTKTIPIIAAFFNQSFQSDSQNKAIGDSCWPEDKDNIRD